MLGWVGDKLLHKKTHRHLLEPYEKREAAAAAFLKAVRPDLTVVTGALLDPEVLHPPLIPRQSKWNEGQNDREEEEGEGRRETDRGKGGMHACTLEEARTHALTNTQTLREGRFLLS